MKAIEKLAPVVDDNLVDQVRHAAHLADLRVREPSRPELLRRAGHPLEGAGDAHVLARESEVV